MNSKFLYSGRIFFLKKNPIFQEIRIFFCVYDYDYEYDYDTDSDRFFLFFRTFFSPIFQEIKRSKICTLKSDHFFFPYFSGDKIFFFFPKMLPRWSKICTVKSDQNFFAMKVALIWLKICTLQKLSTFQKRY